MFMLLLLTLILLDGQAPSPGAADYRIAPVARSFRDCDDAASYLAANSVVARMKYRIRFDTDHTRVIRMGPQRYRADAVIHFNIDPTSRVLSMPDWSWPRMNGQERNRLHSYLSALQRHEAGHLRIAQRYLDETGAVSAHIFGPTAAAVRKRLDAAVRRYAQDFAAQLKRRQQVYDRVTQHGAMQREASNYQFPTGPDVLFSCD